MSSLLTPIQEHYLKRELVKAQIDYEVLQLSDFKSIKKLGQPFSDVHDGYTELPIMAHIFNSHVTSFPFVNRANQEDLWHKKVLVFLESLAGKELSSTADRSEETKRRRIGRKLTNLIALYMNAGLQTTTPQEKTSRVQPPAEDGVRNIDLDKIVFDLYDAHYINGIDVNVVGVRVVSERRGFLYEDHPEFIIKAQLRGAPPVYVARRYSDFKKLQTRLEKEFAGKTLPALPSRNKTSTVTSDSGNDHESIMSEESDPENENSNRSGLSFMKVFQQREVKSTVSLPREKQRITLRSYLRVLLQLPHVAKSQTMLEFLFRDKLSGLSQAELIDADNRRKLDVKRIEDQIEFYRIATERARVLEHYMTEFKQDLMKPGGLQKLFSEIRDKESIQELSPKFQKFLQWAEIEFAGTLYNMLVADDNSPELFSQISRIHKLLPYSLLKTILRFSNPMAIMKGVIDLFLAQPLGKRSLLQNILKMILADDMKAQEKAIKELQKKTDQRIISTLDLYLSSDYSVKEAIRNDSIARNTDILISVFTSPLVSDRQLSREVLEWHVEWNNAVDGIETFNEESVEKYSDLTELFKQMVRRRDKDQMQQLWDEASTMGLVKELLTIFYGPLVDVFRSAKVHEAVGDFEKFMSDLMKVVDNAEQNSLASNPNQMVQEFFDLCERHIPDLFKFVHNVYVNDSGLFDEIMTWISNIMVFLREGNSKQVDFNKLCKMDHTVDMDKVKAEMDSVVRWIEEKRIWREKQVNQNQRQFDSAEAIKTWQDAIPTQGLDTSTFGLDQNDIDSLNDEQLESDMSDDEDQDYENLTPVEFERRKREKLIKKLEMQARVPKKPVVKETLKLRPYFQVMLSDVLRP